MPFLVFSSKSSDIHPCLLGDTGWQEGAGGLGPSTTWVWIYSIIWCFFQDLAKEFTFWSLNHYQICPNFPADMTPYVVDT